MADGKANSLRGFMQEPKPGMVTIVGVLSDENSSFMRGAALAPARIREVLHSGAVTLCAENGVDLGTEPRWQDLGDLKLDRGTTALAQIERAISGLLEWDATLLALGGDRASTFPIIRAYAPITVTL